MTPSLLERDTLVIRQRRKLFELVNTFDLLDTDGAPIGSAAQIGQSPLAMLARLGSGLDVALAMTLEMRDADGTPVLVLHKPWFRMQCMVKRPGGETVGAIRKELRVGKARFVLTAADGERLGVVRAQNWRAKDFTVHDADDVEVAWVAKQWRGLATELLTDADSYAVRLSPDLHDPLRSLAIASCLAVDTVMKQKDSG